MPDSRNPRRVTVLRDAHGWWWRADADQSMVAVGRFPTAAAAVADAQRAFGVDVRITYHGEEGDAQ